MPDAGRLPPLVGATAPLPGPPPPGSRTVSVERRVRLGDVRPDGRARLDAVARWCQDIAADDVRNAGVEHRWRWVVRRTLVQLGPRRPVYDEPIEVTTWCSGAGAAWAERRTTVRGEHGGLVEVASVWAALDPTTMRPTGLGPTFGELYGKAAAERRVRARLLHPAEPPPGATVTPWPLRISDLDALGHVNNAVAWALAEDAAVGAGVDLVAASVEYRDQLRFGPLQVAAAGVDDGRGFGLWVSEPGGPPALTIEAVGPG